MDLEPPILKWIHFSWYQRALLKIADVYKLVWNEANSVGWPHCTHGESLIMFLMWARWNQQRTRSRHKKTSLFNQLYVQQGSRPPLARYIRQLVWSLHSSCCLKLLFYFLDVTHMKIDIRLSPPSSLCLHLEWGIRKWSWRCICWNSFISWFFLQWKRKRICGRG